MNPASEAGATHISLIAVRGLPELRPGADLPRLMLDALARDGLAPAAGDIFVVTHKAVSKVEGRLLDLRTIVPSPLAQQFAAQWDRDARQVEVVLRESRRIVRMDHGLIIAETAHGLVCANAGVDQSNVPGDDMVCLLPLDPDASAAAIRQGLRAGVDVDTAVIVSDSFGRPWRQGIVNVAIGVSGLAPLIDYRGQPDTEGRLMSATVMAVADELASAAELVTGKLERCPVVLIRGYAYNRAEGHAREMVMDPSRDLFR